VVRLYNQMAEPKYVIAMGLARFPAGRSSRDTSAEGDRSLHSGDVHIPGCPRGRRPLLPGLMTLQKKIDVQSLTGRIGRGI